MTATGSGRAQLVACLQQVADGNADALQRLYQLTFSKLHGVAHQLLKSREEAAEVVHEAFLAVWTQAHRFDSDRGSPITWLVAIVRNRALDRLRTRRLHGVHVSLENGMEVADGLPDPFALLAQESDAARLRKCLEVLDPRTRRLITSAFFEGHTYSELARQDALPLGTIKTIIRRGLQRLRREWDEVTEPNR